VKFVIAVVIIVGLSLGAWQIHHYWGTSQEPASPPRARSRGQRRPTARPASQVGAVLEAARQRGATGCMIF